MIQLRNLPEALRAGWANFRSTLFAVPRTEPLVFQSYTPPEGPLINGDLWIKTDTWEMFYYLTIEKKWVPVRVQH